VALIEAGVEAANAQGDGRAITLAGLATAILNNGLGRYESALTAAQRACEHDDLSLYGWALIELIEAGVRCGRREVAALAQRRLDEHTRASGTDWVLGIEARSRAILTYGQAADALYREAIERLARSRGTAHLARAHLVYGEWLRHENRRLDAREELRRAHDTFIRIGATRSPSAPAASCWPPARRCASPRTNPRGTDGAGGRSPAWPGTDTRTRRSAASST
jgi:hypothetical protein